MKIVEPFGENNSEASEQKRFHLFAFLVSFLVALPLLSTTYLTLFDYPNHVARYGLISRFQDSTVFRDFFAINPSFIPNLGFDVLAVNLSRVLPLGIASQLILFLAVFSTSYGLCSLSRQIQGRTSWLTFLPPVFLWSFSLVFGFNNYILGFSFFPWSLLCFDKFLRGAQPRYLVGYCLLGISAFVCHGQAAALIIVFAGILAGTQEVAARQRFRGIALAALPVVLLIPLPLASPSSGEFSQVDFGNVKHKIRMIFQAFLTGSLKADIAFLLFFTGLTIYLFVSKQVAFTRRTWQVLTAGIVVCILMPSKLKIASNLDTRVIPIVAAMLFVFLRPAKKLSPHLMWLIPGLLLFRSAAILLHLKSAGVVAESVQREMAKLPDNAIVFNVVADSNQVFNENTWNPPVLNLAYYGLWRRPLFITGLYSYPNQQPLLYSELGTKLDYLGILSSDPTASDQIGIHMAEITKRMALVPDAFWGAHTAYLFVGTTAPYDQPLPSNVQELYREPKFLIARIDRQKGQTPMPSGKLNRDDQR